MAGFATKTFALHDDYETPRSAWEAIQQYIPRNKVIWEPFFCTGASGRDLMEMGYNVIHQNIDFYAHDLGDVIVSNPPFSDAKRVMKRLKQLDKPFILILPSSKINTSYIREWANTGLQIIIPRKRIQFIKVENGEVKSQKNICNFDCFYYCYKMGLPHDIVWLEN